MLHPQTRYRDLSISLILLLAIAGCRLNPITDEMYRSPVDGTMLIYIPAGEFIMGSLPTDEDVQADEMPQRTIYLAGFWIDQVEVSNRLYLHCVEAGACPPIVTPREDMMTEPNYPVMGVTWPGAVQYCTWVERRLPTEAEWEKAARGTVGQRYSWGDSLEDAQMVNIDFRIGDTNDVGSNPNDRSPYGVLDMAGNIFEWTADWYQEDAYLVAATSNPTGPTGGNVRVQRGAAWNSGPKAVRIANRFWAFPDRNDFTGFRCAQSG